MEGVGQDHRGIKMLAAFAKVPDKSKRDEWSEGGVTTLLNAYEEKWIIRNRAKLKGSDWEEIAQEVSSRDNGKKSAKAPNQCKNKIEAMKKRYRTESATGSAHSWHFFPRMDRLLKGKEVVSNGVGDRETVVLQSKPNLAQDLENENENIVNDTNQANAQNGKIIEEYGEGKVNENNRDDGSSKGRENSEFSTPYNQEENVGERILKKRRRREGSDVADSIRMLASNMLKIEQARMEMYRDTERIRAEAEIKRAEMDLKRTEIISKTQLQIAKLFLKGNDNDTSGSSSLVAQQAVVDKICKYCCLCLCFLTFYSIIC